MTANAWCDCDCGLARFKTMARCPSDAPSYSILSTSNSLIKFAGSAGGNTWQSVSDNLLKGDPRGKNERLQNDALRRSGDQRKRGELLPSIRRVPRGGRQRSGARRRNHALPPKDEPRRLPWRATSRAQRSSTVIRWEARTRSPPMRTSSSAGIGGRAALLCGSQPCKVLA